MSIAGMKEMAWLTDIVFLLETDYNYNNKSGFLGVNMDEIFRKFECWYQNKKIKWEQEGVFIDSAGLGQYGHQYRIKLHSENGLGNIVFYESNGMHWVDFEGGNYDYDVMYVRAGIEFDNVNELDLYENEFINHITWNGEVK